MEVRATELGHTYAPGPYRNLKLAYAYKLYDNARKAIRKKYRGKQLPLKLLLLEKIDKIHNSIRDMLSPISHQVSWNPPARRALGLAYLADVHYDEHGSTRGDYRTTYAIDYVDRKIARNAPFMDSGRAGLGLVEVRRKRVYAKSSKWYPATTSNRFLVGRNENGTFFAHAVSSKCSSVWKAVDWIWGGRADKILRRQGDIAVMCSRGSNKSSSNKLPNGHVLDNGVINHDTHPPMSGPRKGEVVIVGRRAAVRAARETRD